MTFSQVFPQDTALVEPTHLKKITWAKEINSYVKINYYFNENQNLTNYRCINDQVVQETQLLSHGAYINYCTIIASLIWNICKIFKRFNKLHLQSLELEHVNIYSCKKTMWQFLLAQLDQQKMTSCVLLGGSSVVCTYVFTTNNE